MNLKERGMTIGDLVIILIIILATTILVKSLNKDKKTIQNHINHEKVFYKKILLSKMHLTNLSL